MGWIGEGTWVDEGESRYGYGEGWSPMHTTGQIQAPAEGGGRVISDTGYRPQLNFYSGGWANAYLPQGFRFQGGGPVSNFSPYHDALLQYARYNDQYFKDIGLYGPSDNFTTNLAVLDKIGNYLVANQPDEWNAMRGFVDSGMYTQIREQQQQADKGFGGLGDAVKGFVAAGSPLATMAAMAYGGNALLGPGGALSGAGATAGIAPEVGALYSGLDTATLAGADLVGAGLTGAATYSPPIAEPYGGFDFGAVSTGDYGFGPTDYGTGTTGGGGGGFSGGGGTVQAPPKTPAPKGFGLKDLISNPTVIGALGGGLLGGAGGSEQTGTMTSEEGLPDWLQGYMRPALDQYSTGIQNFNTDPYGVMPAAGQEFKNTLSGMYLDPSTNKYLTDYFNAGAERVKGTLSPSFGHMQAFGQHSGYNEALSRGLADLSLGIYGGAYEKERDRQSALTAAAPNFLQNYSQMQFAPYQGYLATLSGLGKKKTQPFYENPMTNMIGGLSLGAGIGSIFGKK